MNENFGTKVIKRFYGIHGPLDEYRRNQINRIGNNIAMLLLTFNLLLVVIAGLIVLSTNDYELTFGLMAWSLLLSVFIAGGYTLYETKRYHLAEIDVDAQQVKPTKKKLIKKAIKQGIIFTILIYGLTILTDWLPNKGNLLPLFTNTWTIVSTIIQGIIFGSLMGLYELHQINSDSDKQSRNISTSPLHHPWQIIFIILIIVGFILLLAH